jgi:hypothetical protein
MPFVWVIRSWCSVDSFWEAVRSSKEFDTAFSKPEHVLEEIERIVLKEQKVWKDTTTSDAGNKDFLVELPTIDQIKNRPFYKFLSVISSSGKEQDAHHWYIERLHTSY